MMTNENTDFMLDKDDLDVTTFLSFYQPNQRAEEFASTSTEFLVYYKAIIQELLYDRGYTEFTQQDLIDELFSKVDER